MQTIWKRFHALLMAVLLTASIGATALASEPDALPFTDVTETDWFYDVVSAAYAGGLMSGITDTTFAPNAGATRAMLVTILWRLEGSPEAEGGTSFRDVAEDAYYAPAVRWASSLKIVNGNTNGTFSPNGNITREQMAVILYRYAQSKDASIAETEYAELDFADTKQVSEYAYEAMCWCASERIITGNREKVDPQGTASRAQVAAILVRLGDD